MKSVFPVTGVAAGAMLIALASCSTQEEKVTKPSASPAASAPKAAAAKPDSGAKDEAKAEAKVKAEKAKGDIGLIDTEKNYLILVTKEGKLVTLDFDQKTKVTEVTPTPAKIADVGLGSSATVTYTKQQDKNIATGVEFKAAKGGD
jgi:ABC-type Na+ efflux pump permease subunit